MRSILVGALVLACVGVAVYALAIRERPRPSEEWGRHWDARLDALRPVLGPADDQILTSPVPFHLGGSADVLTFRQHAAGVCYVTAGIIGDDRAKPNKLGQYELMICLRDPDEWAPRLISDLAKYTTEAVLAPGDTMDIAPALPQPARLDHLLFVPYAEIHVDGAKAGLLLCLGITADEYAWLREHGSDALVSKLKQANVYPFTDLARASVISEP